MLDKDISFPNMEKSISKKNSVKDSASKPSGKTLPGDKFFGLDPDVLLYDIEDRYDT